jgi:hypothetical protein
MSFIEALLSVFDDEQSSFTEINPPSHGGVNIDGTPMLGSTFDVNGDPFGCPSSLCDSDEDWLNDEWINSDDLFDDD